jgi:hypothetical protein
MKVSMASDSVTELHIFPNSDNSSFFSVTLSSQIFLFSIRGQLSSEHYISLACRDLAPAGPAQHPLGTMAPFLAGLVLRLLQ